MTRSVFTLYIGGALYISLYHLDIHQMLLDLGLLGQDLESRNCSQVKTERNDSGLVSFTNLYMAILKRIVDIIWCLNASYLSKKHSRFLSILMGRCRTHCVQQVGEVLRDFPVASFSLDVSLIFVTKLTNPNKSQLSTSRAIIKYCSIDLVQGGELLCTYIINSSSARIRNRGDLRHETPSLRFTIGSGTRHHRSIFSFESTSSIYSNLDLMVKQTPGKVYVLPTVT